MIVGDEQGQDVHKMYHDIRAYYILLKMERKFHRKRLAEIEKKITELEDKYQMRGF